MSDRMVSVEALCARLNEYPIPTRIGITAVMKLIEEVATQGADEPVCNCKAEHWQPHAQYCPVLLHVRDQFRKSGESAQGADARPVAIYQVQVSRDIWSDVDKEIFDSRVKHEHKENCRIVYATRDAAPSDAQPVGVISVTEEHGWHMEPLVGWEELGYGRRLFAEQSHDVLIPANPYIAPSAPREKT